MPAKIPHLFADPQQVERWSRELAAIPQFKIGINWHCSITNAARRTRPIPLIHFRCLAQLDGVRLFSLQKQAGLEQLQQVAGQFSVTDLGRQLDEGTGAFVDTAAVMMNLDLVITADTSIAHLAGGLGVPVWLALSTCSDWRWMLDREDSPWYPTMRLFRQRERGNWPELFERIAAEVRRYMAAGRGCQGRRSG